MPPVNFPDSWVDLDRPAYVLVDEGHVAVTYRELVDQSRRIARRLYDDGLRHGDHVALSIENVRGFLEVAWACQRSGLRYTAISTRLTPAEIAYIVRDAGSAALFVSSRVADAVAEAAEVPSLVARYSVDGACGPFVDLSSVLPDEAGDVVPEAEGTDMLYSSGTTGFPKGVVSELRLDRLGTPPGVAGLLASRWGFDAETMYLSPAPLYHSAPLRFAMTVHRFGGTVLMMRHFDAERALELIERYRVTHTQMVPTMFVRLLRLPQEAKQRWDVSSLRAVIHAAAPCPPEVKRQMIEWFGPVIEEYYSATENNLFTAITAAEALERPGSVGRALVGTPHVLDAAGRELPPGQSGVIWSEGGNEFSYHHDPVKTAEAHNERGWSTIGDLGFVDADGYLYLSDRRADLIISGGVNIYPQEIENTLIMHPAVGDVAVLGVDNPDLGEEVRAVVQPADGWSGDDELAEVLLAFCAEHLAGFKCPKAIDFRAELPRHPTGKLYKRLLRDEYAARSRT